MYKFPAIITLLLLVLVVSCARVGFAQVDAGHSFASGAASPDSTLTADVLSKSLYARTSAEIAYCEFVTRMRDEGVLPDKILYYAYKKAVQQEKSRRFAYFQTVLGLACDKQGVVLEESTAMKVKKFFSFSFSKTKPTQSKSAVPAKPFAFLHQFFAR